ncbi:hypothetical protein Back11_57490 [Paenibacillus baekrokdamisoli]|uniref:Uncharacterized protein n=1 Tax=Paenibacillus baekrokdamisoli TaxID=1712516 RepID=A0A3G9JNG6_9BACL|nr:hypothetical protein Back11_57490 [Paenibacillus baekrokdamisoli]
MSSSTINEYLDEYNDYMRLYEIFGDHEYLEEAIEVLNSLKVRALRAEQHNRIVWKVMSRRIHAY